MQPLSKQRKARLAKRLRARGIPETEVHAQAFERETTRQWKRVKPSSPFTGPHIKP